MASVLVVDDNEHIRVLLCDALGLVGYQVREACNGAIAIDLYRHTQDDLIVLDMFMPEMSGIDTLRILSQEYANLKIVVISGDVQNSTHQDSIFELIKQFEALHIMEKPFVLKDLIQIVCKLHPPDSRFQSGFLHEEL